MNDLMKKWIAALRSGEYRQARGSLCKIHENGGEMFCCLGVAAKMAGEQFYKINGYGPDLRVINDTDYDCYPEFNYRSGELTAELRDKLGISKAEMQILIQMNDGDWASFTAIADWLEAKHG